MQNFDNHMEKRSETRSSYRADTDHRHENKTKDKENQAHQHKFFVARMDKVHSAQGES